MHTHLCNSLQAHIVALVLAFPQFLQSHSHFSDELISSESVHVAHAQPFGRRWQVATHRQSGVGEVVGWWGERKDTGRWFREKNCLQKHFVNWAVCYEWIKEGKWRVSLFILHMFRSHFYENCSWLAYFAWKFFTSSIYLHILFHILYHIVHCIVHMYMLFYCQFIHLSTNHNQRHFYCQVTPTQDAVTRLSGYNLQSSRTKYDMQHGIHPSTLFLQATYHPSVMLVALWDALGWELNAQVTTAVWVMWLCRSHQRWHCLPDFPEPTAPLRGPLHGSSCSSKAILVKLHRSWWLIMGMLPLTWMQKKWGKMGKGSKGNAAVLWKTAD